MGHCSAVAINNFIAGITSCYLCIHNSEHEANTAGAQCTYEWYTPIFIIYLWHLQLMEQDIWSFLFADRIVPDQETQHTGKEGLTPKQKLEFYLP